jgi:glycosyltransferase involved in cell wall biosynthesis
MHIGVVVSNDFDYGPDLANGLMDAGLSVTLYLSKKITTLYLWGESVSKDDVDIDMLIDQLYARHLVPIDCRVRIIDFPRIRNPSSFKATRELSEIIKNDGVELVHILMGPGEIWLAVLTCLIRDIPVVSTMIIPKPNIGERLPNLMFWAISKLQLLGSNKVIVNGADQIEQVHKRYGTPVDKMKYIPLLPRTIAMKWAEQNQSEEAEIIFFPGKVQPRKGLEYLIKAQPLINQQVPDAKILIAARSEELERYRNLIKDQSKFEIHERFLTGSELAAFFQRASVIALPYLTASTSGILLTAYVFEKPVVTTTVGALPEYVEDGLTGYLVPPYDEKHLADAIVRLLSNDALRHQMGQNARRWIENEQSKIIGQTITLYGDMLSNHRN